MQTPHSCRQDLLYTAQRGMGFVWCGSLKSSWPQPRALNVACLMRTVVMWSMHCPTAMKSHHRSARARLAPSHTWAHHVSLLVPQPQQSLSRVQASHTFEPRCNRCDPANRGIAPAQPQVWPQAHVGRHGCARHRPITDFCAGSEVRRGRDDMRRRAVITAVRRCDQDVYRRYRG